MAITLVPVLMLFFIRGHIVPEGRNPINRALIWIYRPVIRLVHCIYLYMLSYYPVRH
jgi:copper/silver efflux system protein